MLITRGKHHCTYHAGPPFAGRFARVVDWWLPLHGCTGPSPSTSPRALVLWLDHVAHRRRGRAGGGSLSLPGHRQGEPAGCSGAEGLGLHPRSVGLFSQLRFPLPGRKREGKGLSSGQTELIHHRGQNRRWDMQGKYLFCNEKAEDCSLDLYLNVLTQAACQPPVCLKHLVHSHWKNKCFSESNQRGEWGGILKEKVSKQHLCFGLSQPA